MRDCSRLFTSAECFSSQRIQIRDQVPHRAGELTLWWCCPTHSHRLLVGLDIVESAWHIFTLHQWSVTHSISYELDTKKMIRSCDYCFAGGSFQFHQQCDVQNAIFGQWDVLEQTFWADFLLHWQWRRHHYVCRKYCNNFISFIHMLIKINLIYRASCGK